MISIENYNQNRGIYSPLIEHNGIICGFWLCGQNYRNPSKLYGAYPPSYLKRMSLLFGYQSKVLHLFSGLVQKGIIHCANELTFDINPNFKPDIIGNAETISEIILPSGSCTSTGIPEKYNLILADPPYGKNYEKYGTEPVNKKKVIRGCSKLIDNGGHLVWLDTIIPIWAKKDGWVLRGTIGLVQSTNHQCRVITILEKK